ncbi:MAG: uridine monophosphate kinase [Planctomycetes bacterium]|nr:uridine monophosphate kinase [Planctomycetota bacterium]
MPRAESSFPGTSEKKGKDRVTSDHMGMLATLINGLAIRECLCRLGITSSVMNAFDVGNLCPTFERDRALKAMTKGELLIFTGGTSNPYFSTDSAAALRAAEIGADILLKATKVDGIYDADPIENPNAKKFDTLTHHEVISRQLRVMDVAAFAICSECNIPIRIFNYNRPGELKAVLAGENRGSLVKKG